MDISNFIAGNYRKGNNYSFFLPEKINHEWIISDNKIQKKLENASFQLGELNSFAKFIPNIDLFIQSYVMKEAITSSRIEGTQTNIEEAFSEEEEVAQEKRDDWKETIQYKKSLNFALDELSSIPLSNRLFKGIHEILLSNVRGEKKTPGEFRRSQNWIGGVSLNDAIFIPPHQDFLPELLSDLENFIHNEEYYIPHLIKIAIIHYQFETIHPFLDGNGRTGRLIIPLYLVDKKILEKPLLYISDFFEKNKSLYYDHLSFVREKNSLSSWILFFLEGVEQTAKNAVLSLKEILGLKEFIINTKISTMGGKIKNATELLDILFQFPILSSKSVANKLHVSPRTANTLLKNFSELGILKEVTGNKRNRIFSFREYLEILKK
jgi:Fic family protein